MSLVKRFSGFTLIELLVVIAIIAVLAAILFPVFARAREKARQTTCSSNQRQIAASINMYTQDHEECYPSTTTVWRDIKVDPGALVCPTLGKSIPNGYYYNPSRSLQAIGDITDTSGKEAWLSADGLNNKTADARHSGKVIASYVDGHVATTTVYELPIFLQVVNTLDKAEMVYISPGTFNMGGKFIVGNPYQVSTSSPSYVVGSGTFQTNTPVHAVTITKGFYIYKYEVKVAQYQAFCTATGQTMPDCPWGDWIEFMNYPITYISYADAKLYAAWAGATLPTEAQWEMAARGTKNYKYPWGDTWDATKCVNSTVTDLIMPMPVGSFPAGTNSYGVQDMCGNVWEWVADFAGAYGSGAKTDPTGAAGGTMRVVRGGAYYNSSASNFDCCMRGGQQSSVTGVDLGFRCVVAVP